MTKHELHPIVAWRYRPLPAMTEAVAQRCADALARAAPAWKPVLRVVEPKPRTPGLRGHCGGAVYFVDCGEFTKIGHTRQVIAQRLDGIETHNPFPLKLWALVAGDVPMERALHWLFAEQRHRNEWFRFSDRHKAKLCVWVREVGGETYE